jgi:hypothetical protein
VIGSKTGGCISLEMGEKRDPFILTGFWIDVIECDQQPWVSPSEPMKLREPPGEVEGLRGSDASEEPPAK